MKKTKRLTEIKKDKSRVNIVLALIVAFVVGVAVTSGKKEETKIVSPKSDVGTSSPIPVPTTVPSPVPTPAPVPTSAPVPTINTGSGDLKDSFIEGCTESGDSSLRYCTCAFNTLVEEYGIAKVIKMSIEADSPSGLSKASREIMVEVATQCLEFNN